MGFSPLGIAGSVSKWAHYMLSVAFGHKLHCFLPRKLVEFSVFGGKETVVLFALVYFSARPGICRLNWFADCGCALKPLHASTAVAAFLHVRMLLASIPPLTVLPERKTFPKIMYLPNGADSLSIWNRWRLIFSGMCATIWGHLFVRTAYEGLLLGFVFSAEPWGNAP